MVLLTSSTISLALSSGIIFTFTFLLFLSGYILQQQTVRGLQEALRAPPPPTPTPTLPAKFRNVDNEDDGLYDLEDGDETEITFEEYLQAGELETGRVGKQFGHPPGSSGHENYEQSVLPSETSEGYGTEKRGNEKAYIQLLSNPDPSEICSALLLFKTLEEADDIIFSDRLLLYPRSWDLDPPSSDMEAAMAMLHAPGHGIEINRIPVDVSGGLISHLVEEELRESSLSLLRQYRSILYLRSPGLIVNVKKLDRVFHSKTLESSSSASDWASPSSWVPTTILQEPSEEPEDALPPVLFVSSTSHVPQRSSLEFYIPSASSPDFSSALDSLPEDHDTTLEDIEPVYVHFQLENEELPDSNSYFRTWRDQLHETCPDIYL